MSTNLTDNEELESYVETGDDDDAVSILGKSNRIFYSGIIRAGVKVPKRTCSPADIQKFKELEAQGKPYDEIDKALGGTPKSASSKLFPANVDFFVIRDCDFEDPAAAQYIRDTYADADGKVRKIPIWVSSGNIADVVPHNYNAFDGIGNIRAYSFFDQDDTQMLRYVPNSVGQNPDKKDWVTTVFEDPDNPPADAPKDIKFGGNYKVRVKGIKGAGEIKVAIRSWNGIKNSIAVLREVRRVLGRFNNLVEGNPFLALEKVRKPVKTKDGKKLQWITTINILGDMADLAEYAETRAARGFARLNQFNGTATQQQASSPALPEHQEAVTTVAAEPQQAQAQQSHADKKSQAESSKPAPDAEKQAATTEVTERGKIIDALHKDTERSKLIDALYKMASACDLTDMELEAYGNFKLRQPLRDETDTNRLRKLTAELDMRLKADKNAVKARCQELLAAAPPPAIHLTANCNDPEVEGMLHEFEKLAENFDVNKEHLLAHVAVLSGGTLPASLSLPQLQGIYGEVLTRFQRNKENMTELKNEFADNYRNLAKASQGGSHA